MILTNPRDAQCTTAYPQLKTKAAETAAIVQALAAIWPQYMNPDDPDHQQIMLALSFSRDLDNMVGQIDTWSPEADLAEQMLFTGKCMLQCCTALNKSYLNKGHLAFHLTFKHHWLVHGLQLARYLSPRHTWTYSGEDYMSKCKTLMASCLKGRGLRSSMDRFMRQYTDAMTIEFAELEPMVPV